MIHHLVIVQSRYVAAILRGTKSIECRLSKTRVPPFDAVHRGDRLWIKLPAGPIVARARVRRVTYYSPVTSAVLGLIASRYGHGIRAEPRFLSRHQNVQYATIILMGNVTRLNPFWIRKRDRRAWVVLQGPPRPIRSAAGGPRLRSAVGGPLYTR